MSDKSFELTDIQQLTPGLYTGDKIELVINYRVQCIGWRCYLGWLTQIIGELNGQRCFSSSYSFGQYGGKDNLKLTFTGLMPHHDLTGKLIFKGCFVGPTTEFATITIAVPNLGDVVPPPPGPDPPLPPVVCTEGQIRCRAGTCHSEICHNGQWVLHELYVPECGYHPVPPAPPDPDPPVPPGPTPPEEDWIEKYKWWIIGGAIAIAIVGVMLALKGKVRRR